MYNELNYIGVQQNAAKFGWLDALLQAAQAIGGAVIPQLVGGGAGSGGQARGLAAIQSATQQILQQLEMLKSQVGQQNYQQIYSDAQRLTALLSDSSVIYQAKKGQDAAVLNSAKARANQILQEIAALGSQVSPVNTTVNQAGQVVTAGGTFTQRILQDNTLLYAGIGLAALYIFTSKK